MTETAPTPSQRSPWVVMGYGLLGFALFVLVLAAVSLVVSPGLPTKTSVTLADGRIVQVEGVTFGTDHELELDPVSPFPPWMFWKEHDPRPVTHRGPQQQVMIWLSCHHPTKTQPDDFSWWDGCVFVDETGHTVAGDHRMRYEFDDSNLSTMSIGDGTLSPSSRTSLKGIVVRTALPMVRKQGPTMTIQLLGEQFTHVGDLEIPWPDGYPDSLPVWKAEPLPVEVSAGEFTVRLNSHKPYWSKWQSSDTGVVRYRQSVNPQFEVLKDGEPAPGWNAMFIIYHDALGNESSTYRLSLAPGEPAWEVTGRLFRQADAEFSDEEAVFRTVSLPAEQTSQKISETIENDLGTLLLLGTYGSGIHDERDIVPVMNSSYGYSSSNNQGRINIDLENSPARLEIKTPTPCIVIREQQIPEGGRVTIHITDTDGNDVRNNDLTVGPYHVLVLDPQTELTEVRLRIAIQAPIPFTMRVPAAEFPPMPTGEDD